MAGSRCDILLGGGMKNEKKMRDLRAMHKTMLARIIELDSKELPKGVDVEKLERAYESLKGYVWTLKKVQEL